MKKKATFDSRTTTSIGECSTQAESVQDQQLKQLTKQQCTKRVSKRGHINKFKNWNQQDTKKFFRSLELFGTDFYIINHFFQDRTRTQLKRKYKKESNSLSLADALKKSKRTKFCKLKERLVALRKEHNESEVPLAQFIRKRFESLASVDSLDIELVEELKQLEN